MVMESDDLAVLDAEAESREMQDNATGSTAGATEAETADELVVSIGDEAPATENEEFNGQPAPDWVKDLRNRAKEDKRRIRELEEKLKAPQAAASVAVVVGKKPTLADCNYDEDDLEKKLDEWHAKKREADDQERKKAEAEAVASAAFRKTQEGYAKAADALRSKVKSFDDAESAVKDSFSTIQQGLLLDLAKSPEEAALLTAAIGSNPKKLKELAEIGNHVKFVSEVARIASQIKTAPRTAPIPERQVRGNASVPGAVDSQLKRLEDEADRTGDRTKVAAYRRGQMMKQRESR